MEALPTVTPVVVEGSKEITKAKVYVDQELVANGLDGRSIALDPGQHRVRAVLPGGASSTVSAVLHQGEKNRVIMLGVSDQAAPRGERARAEQQSPRVELDAKSEQLANGTTLLPGVWIASAIGVSALATGTVFAWLGYSGEKDVNRRLDECAPACSPQRAALEGDLAAARTDYMVANTAFAVSGAAAVTALVFYLVTPTKKDRRPSTAASLSQAPLDLELVPVNGGMHAGVRLAF